MNEEKNKDLLKKNISTDNPEQLGRGVNSKIWGYLLAVILIILVILAIIFFVHPKKILAPSTQTGQVGEAIKQDSKEQDHGIREISGRRLFKLEGKLSAAVSGVILCVFEDQDLQIQ